MRHLFLPACFCLMTLSGSTGSDPAGSLEPFSGTEAKDAEVLTQTELRGAVQEALVEQSEEHDSALDASQDPPHADVTIETPAQVVAETKLPLPRPVYADRVVSRSPREICDTLIVAAQSNDLPIPFFVHLLLKESGFQPNVVSRAGAQGIAQFMPETAATVGLDNPFDPLQAITASARLLRDLAKQFGNLGLAAAAYNAGPRRIQDWLAKKGKLPEETQDYVKTITGRPAKTWMAAAPGNVAQTVPRSAPCREAAGLVAANDAQHRVQVAAVPVMNGKVMIAARVRAKLAQFSAEKTPTIMAPEHAKPGGANAAASKAASKAVPAVPSKPAAKFASTPATSAGHPAQAAKGSKGAIQLAAATKKKAPRKLQLSQR